MSMFPFQSTSPDVVTAQGAAEKIGFINPSWNRRWFVLNQFTIDYYKDQSSFIYGKEKKGSFRLSPSTKITCLPQGPFQILENARYFKPSKDEAGHVKYQVITGKSNAVEFKDVSWDEGTRTFYLSFATEQEKDTFVIACCTNLGILRATTEGRQEAIRGGVNELIASGLTPEDARRYCETVGFGASLTELRQLLGIAERGDPVEMKKMKERGMNIIVLPDSFGTSTFIQAAAHGNTPMCRYLLSEKCDIHARTTKGNTALHVAARGDHYGTVKFLLENKADISLQNNDQMTALQLAVDERVRSLLREY